MNYTNVIMNIIHIFILFNLTQIILNYLILPIPYTPVVTSLNKLTSGGKYVNITKHINKNIRIITDKLSVKTVLSSSQREWAERL